MSMALRTALVEQSSLSFHCHTCRLFHNQKLSFLVNNCSRCLKFNICGPDLKMCIYIENVLFPPFFETYYITVYTVVGKVCDIKYCVKIFTALV